MAAALGMLGLFARAFGRIEVGSDLSLLGQGRLLIAQEDCWGAELHWEDRDLAEQMVCLASRVVMTLRA